MAFKIIDVDLSATEEKLASLMVDYKYMKAPSSMYNPCLSIETNTGSYKSLGTMYGPVVVNPPKSPYWFSGKLFSGVESMSETKLLSVEDRLRALITAYNEFPNHTVTAHIKTFEHPIYKNILTMFPSLENYKVQSSLVAKIGWLTVSNGLFMSSHSIELWKEN